MKALRILTVVNLSLWTVLVLAWIPYSLQVGFADPISSEVRWILATTAVLLILLGFVRLRKRRPLLG